MSEKLPPCPLCGNAGDGPEDATGSALLVGVYGPRYGRAGRRRCGLSVTVPVAGTDRAAKQAAIDEAVRRWNRVFRGPAYPPPYTPPGA